MDLEATVRRVENRFCGLFSEARERVRGRLIVAQLVAELGCVRGKTKDADRRERAGRAGKKALAFHTLGITVRARRALSAFAILRP